MCGIFTFSHSTQLTRLMTPTLAICMEQRGDHSWGVTDGDFLYKTKGSIIDTFVDCDLDGPLYHTRMASVGAISDRNAHPFHFEDKNIITGVHNGHISNYDALKTKYGRKDAEVDSEHIFLNLAEGKPVADLTGSGAIVWYEQPADKSVPMRKYFSRFNTEAFHFAKMRSGEIVFASTKDSIQIASQLAGGQIQHFFDTTAKKRYWIEQDPELAPGQMGLYSDILLPWAESPVYTQVTHTPSVSYTHHGGFNTRGGLHSITAGDCPARMCATGKITKDQIICDHCFKSLKDDIFGVATA